MTDEAAAMTDQQNGHQDTLQAHLDDHRAVAAEVESLLPVARDLIERLCEAFEAGVGADEAADALALEGDGDLLVAAHPLGADHDAVSEAAMADAVAGAPGQLPGKRGGGGLGRSHVVEAAAADIDLGK